MASLCIVEISLQTKINLYHMNLSASTIIAHFGKHVFNLYRVKVNNLNLFTCLASEKVG